jgi:hypothetical protein
VAGREGLFSDFVFSISFVALLKIPKRNGLSDSARPTHFDAGRQTKWIVIVPGTTGFLVFFSSPPFISSSSRSHHFSHICACFCLLATGHSAQKERTSIETKQ